MKKIYFIAILSLVAGFVSCKKHVNNDFCDCANSPFSATIDSVTLMIPTTITPNGDGNNDLWIIDGIENFPESTLEIHRTGVFGSKVFEASPYQNDWDGMNLKSGKYKYKLTIGSQIIAGFICIYNDQDMDDEYYYDCVRYNNVVDVNDPLLY